MRFLGCKLRCLTMVWQMMIGFLVFAMPIVQKRNLPPRSVLSPRPVKEIKTEGTWTALQVEFLWKHEDFGTMDVDLHLIPKLSVCLKTMGKPQSPMAFHHSWTVGRFP